MKLLNLDKSGGGITLALENLDRLVSISKTEALPPSVEVILVEALVN